MQEFKDRGFDRKNADLKELRMLLVGGIFGSNKPWEVLIGQVIGQLRKPTTTDYTIEGKLFSFLGQKVVGNLIPV